jgi:hypothetical protein
VNSLPSSSAFGAEDIDETMMSRHLTAIDMSSTRLCLDWSTGALAADFVLSSALCHPALLHGLIIDGNADEVECSMSEDGMQLLLSLSRRLRKDLKRIGLHNDDGWAAD